MKCQYFVVPSKKKEYLKGIGALYQTFDKNFAIVFTEDTAFTKQQAAALNYFVDGKTWGFTLYAKGKDVASYGAKGLKGDVAQIAKLLGADAKKLEAALEKADSEAFRKAIGFALYGVTGAQFKEETDNDCDDDRVIEMQEPIKK